MSLGPLPQEIILLLCEELAARQDFNTLFQCSLVSRRVARIALEKLYSIQELSPVNSGDVYYKPKWYRLWRSIILSSVGEATAYPYCAYVRLLSFGNLEECLQDMYREPELRDAFFEDPMWQFFVPLGVQSKAPGHMNTKGTMIKCADSITAYIKHFADETETAPALQHLEGLYFPYDILPSWISRLSTLRSLRIRDGSVLGNVEAARTISECCPNFNDLTCYYYQSPNADEELAMFFQTLRPNSLQSFEVISQNGIGQLALTALNAHAASLRKLILGSLTPIGMLALNSLAGCTALENLEIENDMYNIKDMSQMHELLREISAWISSCKSLRRLSFNHFLDVIPVVKGVLNAPDIRLKSLSIVNYTDPASAGDVNEDVWAALGTQDSLESLTLGMQSGFVDGLVVSESSRLATSIFKLKELTTLNLMQAWAGLPFIWSLTEALPGLAELNFSSDGVDDHILDPLSTLSQLKLLSINAPSAFTFDGLYSFLQTLATPDHQGIRIDILCQHGDFALLPHEMVELTTFMSNNLKGRIDITYTDDNMDGSTDSSD
ncbi:hypothetical protein GGR52DRAFT_531826 [Hypoxylon sp. FL1284]|nr:hypothetical protein GGR52DRAFT_531826 [Hypoxylon sp. FL1284]